MSEPTQRGFLVFLGNQVFYCLRLLLANDEIIKCLSLIKITKIFIDKQRFSVQLWSPDASPSMHIAALRTLSYALKTLGEVRHGCVSVQYIFYTVSPEIVLHTCLTW